MLRILKRKISKIIPLLKLATIIGGLVILFLGIYRVTFPFYEFAKVNNLSAKFFLNLLLNKEPAVKMYKGRTNILLLGVSGGAHDGSDLTDTILFLSIDWSKKDIVMLSLPRDMWLPSLKDKINSAYHYGEARKKGGGFVLAKASAEEVIGQPISYAYLLDFSAFKEMIDLVNGIDVNVPDVITDKEFPIAGKENDLCDGDITFSCRYENIRFEKGLQHMDGETALKYVRTRHTEGTEGTDFARGRRQQQVLIAFKNTFLKLSFLNKLNKLNAFIRIFQKLAVTDMNWAEKITTAKFLLGISDSHIRQLALNTGDEGKKKKGFLVNPPLWQFNERWVLIPRIGDGQFQEIAKYIACNLEDPQCTREGSREQ